MNKKKAKLQYKHNSFDIIEEGNFVERKALPNK